MSYPNLELLKTTYPNLKHLQTTYPNLKFLIDENVFLLKTSDLGQHRSEVIFAVAGRTGRCRRNILRWHLKK